MGGKSRGGVDFSNEEGGKKSPCVRLKAGSQVVLVPKREAIEV